MKEILELHLVGLYANKFLDALENAFRINSTDLIQVYHKEAAKCVSRGRYNEAISLCQKAIKLDQADVEAHYQLAIAHIGMSADEKAIESLQKVLKLDPECSGAHFRLGVLLEKTGSLEPWIRKVSTGKPLNRSTKPSNLPLMWTSIITGLA
ncbi:MAG: tetratricopeptide repeat protein [Planctomycetota bacterium]|jgi:tetratricopeptide (TPR) repeat protein